VQRVNQTPSQGDSFRTQLEHEEAWHQHRRLNLNCVCPRHSLSCTQDYPKALPAGARVGFTVINQVCGGVLGCCVARWAASCFTACVNEAAERLSTSLLHVSPLPPTGVGHVQPREELA
jgi:hypothetical protein